jgi:heme exporter protein D
MQWDSLGDFLRMGGYGFYVWSAYAVTALGIVAELLALRARSRRARAESDIGRGAPRSQGD